jgi:hypothetical protein
MGSLRDDILSASDLKAESVDTPEWEPFGHPTVLVRGLTAAERDQYEQNMVERSPDGGVRTKSKIKNLRASFVAMVVVKENGEREFTDADVDALGGKNANVIDRLWDKGRELSGMVREAEVNPSLNGSGAEPSSG